MDKQTELDVLEESSSTNVDKKQARALLRKIDLHLMVPLWVVFVFGFLDRINLGNVSILGIVPELRMSGTDLTIAMQIFFVPYILADIPSNIILKRFAPSTWISTLAFFWGVTCMCQGFVKSSSGLIACRFVLGDMTSGRGSPSYGLRGSLIWTARLIAGAVGGLLAYALNHMHDLGGYSGWRWIFIIEGLLSVAASIPARFIIADWPEQASFLNNEEKSLPKKLNAQDVGGGARMDRLDRAAWRRILSDWKIYVGSLVYLGVTVSGYATALFIPSIVFSLGYDGIDSQIQSVPVWAVAAVVTVIVSHLTDRMRHRYSFIMFGVVFASIGYIILLCQGPIPGGLSVRVRYMAVFFPNNLSGHYKRAISLALQIGIGNMGGIVASNVFNKDAGPSYTVGYSVSLAMMLLCGIMSTVFAAGLVIENKKRNQGKRDDRLRMDTAVLNNLGDDDPRFRFSL